MIRPYRETGRDRVYFVTMCLQGRASVAPSHRIDDVHKGVDRFEGRWASLDTAMAEYCDDRDRDAAGGPPRVKELATAYRRRLAFPPPHPLQLEKAYCCETYSASPPDDFIARDHVARGIDPFDIRRGVDRRLDRHGKLEPQPRDLSLHPRHR